MITKKQLEALKHVANGSTMDQTADEMCISRSTVEKHLLVVKRIFKARNLVNAVYKATKIGLISVFVVNIYQPTVDQNIAARTRTTVSRRVREYHFDQRC